MRTDFHELELPSEFLLRYPPEENALFEKVRANLSVEARRVLESHSTGQTQARINFVCSTYRKQRKPTITRPEEFHLAKVFGWLEFLRAEEIDSSHSCFYNQIPAMVLESCLELGEPYLQHYVQWATWALTTLRPWDDLYLFITFTLLVAIAFDPQIDEATFARYESWFIRAKREIMVWHDCEPEGTFLDLTYAVLEATAWQGLAMKLRGQRNLNPDMQAFVNRVISFDGSIL